MAESEAAQSFSKLGETSTGASQTTTTTTPTSSSQSTGLLGTMNMAGCFAMPTMGMLASSIESCSGTNIVEYFDKLEQRAKLDGWDETITLKLFKFKLIGEAISYFRSRPELDTLTYAELKKEFCRKFARIILPGEALLKLSQVRQRQGENVASFSIRIRSAGISVLNEDLRTATSGEEAGLRRKVNDLMLNQFKLGLKKDYLRNIGALLLQESNLTLERAEEIVRLQETAEVIAQGDRVTGRMFAMEPTERVCYNCGEKGHLSRECPRKKCQANFRCYGCNQEGHIRRNCPRTQRMDTTRNTTNYTGTYGRGRGYAGQVSRNNDGRLGGVKQTYYGQRTDGEGRGRNDGRPRGGATNITRNFERMQFGGSPRTNGGGAANLN